MGSGGMIVMDQDTNMVEVARFFMEFCRDESCGKCIPCRAGTVQLHRLLVRLRDGNASAEDLAQLEGLTELVILDLERTAVTEAGLESLRKLPKLMMLEIPKGQISDAAIDKFKAARPGVTLSIVP